MDPLVERGLLTTRREFFGRTTCGIGTAALAWLLARDGLAAPRAGIDAERVGAAPPAGIGAERVGAAPRAGIDAERVGGLPALPHFAPRAKRVIYLFQNGAPTHVDLFDYKPRLRELHGKPVPESYVAGKRFSTMTGSPKGKLLLGDADSRVGYGRGQLVWLLPERQSDVASGRCEFDAVFHQVTHHLP